MQTSGRSRFGRLALALALLQGLAGGAAAEVLTLVGSYTWETDSVVGLSGLEVSDDGSRFVAISDRGWILTGGFLREGARISGIRLDRFLPILGQDGLPVAARRLHDWSDAEGLAMAPDGTLWIAFEQWTRVARYATPESAATWIRDHPSFRLFAPNRQLESVALDPGGTLYTFPEQPLPGGFPIYRLEAGAWTIAGYFPQQSGFAVVGADFASDGRLYLLERKLVLGLWWQNRIRRLTLTAAGAPARDELLWTGGRGEYDNLEGIAVWPDGAGLRLTLVSDSNSDPDEPTQFVEFRLGEAEQ